LSNINGLSNITSIGGYLNIQGNNELSNINGLSNLTTVTGYLTIWSEAIVNFCPLYNLLFNNGLGGSLLASNIFGLVTKEEIIAGGDCSQYFILSTQAEVDNFNYTSLPGLLIIDDAVNGNITNLDGLSELTSIGGNLIISNNPGLTNISGLSNLTSVGEKFYFIKNYALINLDGLSNLDSIGGTFYLFDNRALTNINGLSDLTSIGNDCVIRENSALTNINGLSNLTSIGGDFRVKLNNALLNIDGLTGLTQMIGTLEISQNFSLANINGLLTLTSIGVLSIRLNPSLGDIDGLSNLTYAGTLAIISNYSLIRYCGLYKLFSSGTFGTINIADNPNQPTQQEIIDGGPCALLPVELTSFIAEPKEFALEQNYPNPFNPSTIISWQLPVSSHVSLKVYDILGNQVANLIDENKEAGYYESNYDGSALASGMYIYKLAAGDYVSIKKMLMIK